MREPLFIVGMYKSGTSWLLRILDQHPLLRGVKEIDLIGAGAGKISGGNTLLPRKERLMNYFGGNAWGALPTDLQGDYQAISILKRNTGSDSVQSIFDLPAEQAIDAILELYALRNQRGKVEWAPYESRELLSIVDVPKDLLVSLYMHIARADTVYTAADSFVKTMYMTLNQNVNLVFKGADTLARYEMLAKWKPNAIKIVIVRDGRDAAISAMHYRQLMRSVKRANVDDEVDYWSLYKGWCNRVRILMSLVSDKNLILLRYEDLVLRFESTVIALFEFLNLPFEKKFIHDIYSATKFESLTKRKPGEAASHVMRRGMLGEWKESLSSDDAVKAWKDGGIELSYLGYTESGEYLPMEISDASCKLAH